MMQIRKACPEDMPVILKLYEAAREFMAQHGNPRQWGATGWPPEKLLYEDIEREKLYVCTQEDPADQIAAVFYYDYGEEVEPSYADIEEGGWKDFSAYGVVHRIAADPGIKGAGTFCIRWAFSQSGHLRIDTHPDNYVMQNLLKKLGFERRGIIHVREDNDPRFAYEKSRTD